MPDENTPEQPTQQDIEAFEQFQNMTIDAWSRTLVTCTRRIRELEKQMLAAQGEIVALKQLVMNRPRSSFDA